MWECSLRDEGDVGSKARRMLRLKTAAREKRRELIQKIQS